MFCLKASHPLLPLRQFHVYLLQGQCPFRVQHSFLNVKALVAAQPLSTRRRPQQGAFFVIANLRVDLPSLLPSPGQSSDITNMKVPTVETIDNWTAGITELCSALRLSLVTRDHCCHTLLIRHIIMHYCVTQLSGWTMHDVWNLFNLKLCRVNDQWRNVKSIMA